MLSYKLKHNSAVHIDHLGNVKVTVSDRKLPVDDGTYSGGVKINSTPDGIFDYFEPDVLSAVDHYPFGMEMPGRSFNSTDYAYDFNGKRTDHELNDWQDYGMRMYMKRLGRFPTPDPISKKYPYLSPYQFASNSPIGGIDLDGLEFANPQATMRRNYPVLTGIYDGVTASLTNTWNFFTHDAWTPEPYVAAWNLYGEFIDMSTYGYSGHAPSPTPGMNAIAQSVEDNIINGDAYSRSKAGAQIGTDLLTAYAGSKGLSALKFSARTNLATQFYKKAGYTGKRAANHMAGINFEKAVQTTTLKKGTVVQQWVGEDGVGSYFTPLENGAAQNLGLPDYGKRTLQQFTLTDDVKVLQSTASELGGNAGGGTQYFSPDLKNSITPVTE